MSITMLSALLVFFSHLSFGVALSRTGRRPDTNPKQEEPQGCASLVNKGTHFTVDVQVGTPAQTFSVVADTGSNSLIIPSCMCHDTHKCTTRETPRCFRGNGKSSTFEMQDTSNGFPVMDLTFGSGTIRAVIATDNATIGHVKARMQDGVLLMVDRALQIEGEFEGILGLGIPQKEGAAELFDDHNGSTGQDQTTGLPSQPGLEDLGSLQAQLDEAVKTKGPQAVQDMVAQIMGMQGMQGQVTVTGNGDSFDPGRHVQAIDGRLSVGSLLGKTRLKNILEARQAGTSDWPQRAARRVAQVTNPMKNGLKARQAGTSEWPGRTARDRAAQVTSPTFDPRGFLDYAGVSRFTMCFNEGTAGVLRLGSTPNDQHLGSVGQLHWGLDFRGISIGKASAPVLICSPESRTKDQQTACGIIPDSGTTLIMGPEDQVETLLTSVCDSWDRCKQNHTALIRASDAAHTALVENFGFDPYRIDGNQSKATIARLLLADCGRWLEEGQGLDELPPLHFHVAGNSADGPATSLELPAWAYIMEASDSQTKTKVCEPMFGAMNYNTKANGPVWIMGTPLFYEYQVGYNTKTVPPSMSFSSIRQTPCGSCDAQTSLLSAKASSRAYHPRKLGGPPRMPILDTRLPL